MRRLLFALAVIPLLAIAADYLPDGGVDRSSFVRFADFGTDQDYSHTSDVYFPKPPENYWLWGMEDAKKFIRYEKPGRFHWVTKPTLAGNYTNARVLKSYYSAKIRIQPLNSPSRQANLAIRYKDNLLQPTTVEQFDQGQWVKIGELPGKFDHNWKVAVLPVKTQATALESGTYLIRIGRGDYGDLNGDLPIDWVGLATKKVNPLPPIPGFWPQLEPSAFAGIGRTQEYVPGKGPKFLAGVLVKGMRKKSWERFAQHHVNSIIFQGWETQWRRHWEIYTSGAYNDRVRAGFPEWMEECAKNNLLCTSQFFTDTRSYWIERQYSNEYDALDVLGEVMKFNRNAAGNLCWYLKDEADHNDSTWGAPVEFIIQLYNRQKKYDPTRAAAILFQGWKPGSFAAFKDVLDIAAFDVYPLGAGRKVTEISDRIERMRHEVGPEKALWAVIEAHEGEHVRKLGRQLTAAETLVQGYLCLAHDLHGVFYYIGNEATYIDVDEMPGPWSGMKQFFAEVNGPNGLASWFVPPARTLARTGVANDKTGAEDSAIHFIYKRNGQNRPLLIAVNTTPRKKQSSTLFVEDLPAGTTVKVMFENRTLVAGDNGQIQDNFAPYARRVYTW